jgi:hypothetical protein
MTTGFPRLLAIPLLVFLAACASDDGSSGGGGGTAADLVGQGALTATIDGKDFSIDYTGIAATAVIKHRINTDPDGFACIPEVHLTMQHDKKGACKLELIYKAGFSGQGLLLNNVRFHAKVGIKQDDVVIATVPCPGWTDEPADGEVVYELADGDGSINIAPLEAPDAAKSLAVLNNLELKPQGVVKMKYKGRQFDLDLGKIQFKGDVVSEGDASLSCTKDFQELPKWEHDDVNPDSKGFNTTYGLEAFKGKVVALVFNTAP